MELINKRGTILEIKKNRKGRKYIIYNINNPIGWEKTLTLNLKELKEYLRARSFSEEQIKKLKGQLLIDEL